MKALYINGAQLGLTQGNSNADAVNIGFTNTPVYVGGFVADSGEEFDAIRTYLNSVGRLIIADQDGETANYAGAKALLPWLFTVPIAVKTYRPTGTGSIRAQELFESIFNVVNVIAPPVDDVQTITGVTINRNNIIAHVKLNSYSGFSFDGGATWTNAAYGYVGGVSYSTGSVELPIYRPDFSKYYAMSISSAWSTASRYDVAITKGNRSELSTNSTVVAALTRMFDIKDANEISDADPYDTLPVPGDDPLPGGGAVGIPGFPGLTATSAGVIGLFCPSAAQMQLLADFMWTDFGGSGTTVEDILKEVVEAIKRTISNPLDYIVGLNIIPSQGLSIGGSKSVRFGFVDSGVTMPLLANQYFTVDCGSIAFDTVCGNTFLDYAPYAKFSIYLPYIGFKDVDPNDFVGHSIGVVYHGDCVTGGITAYITKDGSVMYQYSGCCALNVPLSADSWGETISGAISVATGIVAAAATGGAAGVGLAAAKGAASVAANPSLLSPQVNHSGAVSGGAGCMGVQYPFVIREAVNFHSTSGFNKESGYPAYYYKSLSDVTGFTTVLDPHINNIPQATQGEMAEIISLLESGVIL